MERNSKGQYVEVRTRGDELHCSICREWKPCEAFVKDNTRERGYDYRCRECNARRIREAQEKRRLFVAHIKQTKGCVVCGFNEFACSLDFHHLNEQDKEMEMARFRRSGGYKKFLAELIKCIILCKNHHTAVHNNYITLEDINLRDYWKDINNFIIQGELFL